MNLVPLVINVIAYILLTDSDNFLGNCHGNATDKVALFDFNPWHLAREEDI